MKLTPHEQKVLDLIKKYPKIIEDNIKRSEIAKANGMTEKTLRNRIGDLKKYGVIEGESPEENYSDEMTLLGIFTIIWHARWKIFRNVFIASIFAVVLALIMPLTYTTTAVIMPPSSDGSMGISSALSSLSLGGLFQGGGDSESLTFLAILKSRKVKEDVIEKFGLIEFYGVDYMQEALEKLGENTSFEIEEEGTITIRTTAKTSWFHPQEEVSYCKNLVAEMANYFVRKLDEVNKELKGEKTKLHRQFIEKRYNMNISDLKLSEDRLNEFQNKNGTIALPEQTAAAIEIAATIKGQIMAAEVKYEVLKQSLPDDHPDLRNIVKEISELNYQLGMMEKGRENELFPKFSKIPDLGMELVRLTRDVEIQNTLFIFLTQQYEEAKIQEAKDSPTLQVLDSAKIPEKKYKPSRARIVIIIFTLAFILSLYYVYFIERWKLFDQKIVK
ncbi:MAG: hypothetical protein HQ528_02185 [Candidatus Marinimicrobia bacterium]|nr:hypothetical protein [Candidatus Neomarinimicrobiota bacterium]